MFASSRTNRSLAMAHNVFLHLLEKVCRKNKVIESLVCSLEDEFLVADPFTMSLVYENNILAYTQHRVHVMSVDNGCDIVLVSDVAQKFIDEN
jgi:hypothetical protein